MPEAHQGHIAMQGRPNIPAATRYPLQFISPGPGGHQATNIMNTQSAGGQQHHVQQPAGQYIRGGPAVVAPQQQQQQQQQQQYPAQTAPYVARPNTSVKICDISKEQPLTAEKARERLSQYFVFRFTRADEDSGYASDGSRRKPSWKRAWRIEDRGISKREAARMVRELNRTKIPVMQKKGDLSEEERRQIEMALEDLQKQYDNEYFQTTLAQLDDRIEVKPKEQGKVREREREKNRRKEKHRRVVSKQVKQPASKSKDIKQAVTERVSLTAYFKRAPRPDVDAIAMLRHHEAQREARIRQYAQAMARPQEAQYPAPAAPPPPPQPSRQSTPHPPPRPLPPQQNMHGERPGNARGPGPSGHHAQAGHSQNRGPPVTIIQRKPQEHGDTTGRPQPFQPRPSPHVHQRTRAPPSSTDESVYSDGFSDDEDEDTVCTSPSTTSSYISQGSYEHLRTAHTPKPMFREGPAHYGIPPNFPGDGRRQPQGTVHIQPHRSNERRPSLHDQCPPAFSPNHKPVVHQAALAPIPRPGLFPSRPATMTPAQIPIAPSPPPVQVHPAAVTGGVRGPAPITQAAPAPGHHHHHQHIPPPPAHHHQVHHHISPQAPGSQIPVATAVTHTTAAATATVPGGSLDPKQLYDNAYAAGRADSREEAIRMAERIAAAATGSAAQPEPRGSLTVIHRDHLGREGERDRDHANRGRCRGTDRSRRSRSRSRSTSLERSRERERERGRTRTRSRSRNRNRNRNRGRTRSRSSSWDSHGSREGRDRNRERGRRARTPDRTRSRSLDRDGDRRHGRCHSRNRGRDRIIRDPVSPHRASAPVLSRPRSGVRLVRPEDGYVRPRVGMDREGIERDMGRLRLRVSIDDDDGQGPLDHLDREEEEEKEELYDEQFRGGAPCYQGRRRAFVYGGGASRDRDLTNERARAERLRRETERLVEEEGARELQIREPGREDLRRRRDSGVHMGAAPLTASNPFTPRPGLARRTGAATGVQTYTRYRAPRVDDDFDDSLCY